MPSFVKIKPDFSSDIDKACPSCEFLTWQICLFMLFAKIILTNISEFTITCFISYKFLLDLPIKSCEDVEERLQGQGH